MGGGLLLVIGQNPFVYRHIFNLSKYFETCEKSETGPNRKKFPPDLKEEKEFSTTKNNKKDQERKKERKRPEEESDAPFLPLQTMACN